MRVPKYIEEALNKRAKLADKFNHYDLIISQFIDNNGVEVEEYDYHGGCESIVNPYNSSARVYKAILNKDKDI